MWMLMYAGIIGNEVHVFVYTGINILSKANIIRRIPVCGNYGLDFMCKMYKLTVPDEYYLGQTDHFYQKGLQNS